MFLLFLNLGSSVPAKTLHVQSTAAPLAAEKKRAAVGSMWCCCNEETELEVALPKLAASEQVLPPTPEEVKSASDRSLMRAQTVAKLAEADTMHFFTAQFVRSAGTSFGLDVSAVGRVCMVNSVAPNSLVAEWNAKAMKEERDREVIQQYDRLMALNDERPEKGRDMSEKLKNIKGFVSIVIQRPVIRNVTVVKNGLKDLGISIIDGHGFMVVSSVGEGTIISQHNALAAYEDVIGVPTRIISVDGEYGDGFELLQMMEEAGEVFEVETLRFA